MFEYKREQPATYVVNYAVRYRGGRVEDHDSMHGNGLRVNARTFREAYNKAHAELLKKYALQDGSFAIYDIGIVDNDVFCGVPMDEGFEDEEVIT